MELTKHWSLRDLFRRGQAMHISALNANSSAEWQSVQALYERLTRFERVCVSMLVEGHVKADELLSVNELVAEGSIATLVGRDAMAAEEREALDAMLGQVARLSARVEFFECFCASKLQRESEVELKTLELMQAELELLSLVVDKHSLSSAAEIETAVSSARDVLARLEALYAAWRRCCCWAC